MSIRLIGIAAIVASLGATGCAGRMRVELAAADAMEALAGELSRTLTEYQADLEHADDLREAAVADAFVARTQRDHADGARMEAHTRDFAAALARMRADRRTAWERYAAARDNVAAAEEVARELRSTAVMALALDREAQACLRRLLEARQSAKPEEKARPTDAAASGEEIAN